MADAKKTAVGYNEARIEKEAKWFYDLLGGLQINLGGLGCALIRREGQRFFSSLVNEPHQSQWAAIDEARSNLPAFHDEWYPGAARRADRKN